MNFYFKVLLSIIFYMLSLSYVSSQNLRFHTKEYIKDYRTDGHRCLTEEEGTFINHLVDSASVFYDFKKKKVAFFSCGNYVTKDVFFASYPHIGTIFLFNDIEKNEVGGFDAAIVFDNKKWLTKEQIIKELRTQCLRK